MRIQMRISTIKRCSRMLKLTAPKEPEPADDPAEAEKARGTSHRWHLTPFPPPCVAFRAVPGDRWFVSLGARRALEHQAPTHLAPGPPFMNGSQYTQLGRVFSHEAEPDLARGGPLSISGASSFRTIRPGSSTQARSVRLWRLRSP
jgi:hypothetical protein